MKVQYSQAGQVVDPHKQVLLRNGESHTFAFALSELSLELVV
jgi:hypothetical protein